MSKQMWYGSILAQSGQRIDLGHCEMNEMVTRIYRQTRAPGVVLGERFNVSFGTSKELLAEQERVKSNRPKTATEELFEAYPDIPITIPTDDEESPIPGMGLKTFAEIANTQEYKDYAFFSTDPNKRIGVDASHIESIKKAYFDKYPEMAAHFPKWID